ncbi:hypothetical protein QYF61_003644 [Mycteria americana]|uniref:Uncharacterized protein n=1 Tax=Mycteria americana TaxID=33587 RepID=A0AAN7RSN7_MYCAM|nr:hypothetical protein QYF61_003644 [Mycteria americana]
MTEVSYKMRGAMITRARDSGCCQCKSEGLLLVSAWGWLGGSPPETSPSPAPPAEAEERCEAGAMSSPLFVVPWSLTGVPYTMYTMHSVMEIRGGELFLFVVWNFELYMIPLALLLLLAWNYFLIVSGKDNRQHDTPYEFDICIGIRIPKAVCCLGYYDLDGWKKCTLGCIDRSTASGSREAIIPCAQHLLDCFYNILGTRVQDRR